jgi:type II secretory pathway pseudopilin PulG
MFRFKRSKGFTLVEMIIAVGVLMVIMGSLVGMMIRMSTTSAEQARRQQQHALEEQARMALLSLVRDIRLSHDVVPLPGESIEGMDGLQLTARHDNLEFIIVYTLEEDPNKMTLYGDNLIDINGRLERTITSPDLLVPGAAEAAWPNAFSSANMRKFFPEIEDDDLGDHRVTIEFQLAVHESFNDTLPHFEPDEIENFRAWTITSAASFRRRPPT